ncbi:type III secretion protein V [Variovorax boronicumulans]|uniref:flagellar biosynthesis protein FlhA n=1 Tax=Variovorax boronicumulans TaxID=436515 RepID=UPI0027864FF7|nr:flagellar biosynthesis protein FlhA [Variovorax boronicumulans]MDQ0083802.1 type III secretion protein V [Variovorax boronicumulans]
MSEAAEYSLIKNLVPKGGRADVAMSGIVIAIVIAMILPLPVWLLDGLLAANICSSALLIVLVIQVKDPVGLSTFPTLLLITTLMRLSLEVASTRLILLEGYAGHIIEAFGEVVVGGNIVVGFVIFLILTLVQFMVITKGAERVAEVGARFTLDALPGKQMAIDMELRANSLTAEQARVQRSLLAQESQFFGAMDGAMKFVKGDAIAGIIIMLINLIGGLSIGVLQKRMSASEAMHLYSMLTIGDGLVTQVPALLTSLTAGLLVTRAGGSGGVEAPNIGRKLAEQLMAQPKAWVTASGIMLAFGCIPGMPMVVFALLAAGALGFGLKTIRKKLADAQKDAAANFGMIADVREFELVAPLSMKLSQRVQEHPQKLHLINAARSVRNSIVARYGMMLPPLALEAGGPEPGADLALCQNDVALFSMALPAEASIPPDWWTEYSQRIEVGLFKAAPRAFGIQEAQKLMEWIATLYPQLHKELERTVPVGRFADVLQRLIAEQVSICNLKLIAQALVEFGQRERDPALLVEHVRSALSREICSGYAVNGNLSAFMLEVELENAIRDAVRQTSHGSLLDFGSELADPVLDRFELLLKRAAVAKPIILCSQDVRAYVRRVFAERFFLVPVLTLAEAVSGYKFEVVGVIDLYPAHDIGVEAAGAAGGDLPEKQGLL